MGGKTTSTSATKLNGISVQSSTLGLPLAIGWGRSRMKCNLIWYNAFTAIPHTTTQKAGKGLGGGSKNTSYTYTASIMLALGEGPVVSISTVYRDKSVFTSLAAAGLSLATGTPSQPVWGYLTSLYPDQARAYARIAYVYAQGYPLDSSATLPNHSFEVNFPVQMPGLADADPRDILTDFLTNTQYGLPGWAPGLLSDWSDYSAYCRANNLLLSPLIESQVQASAFVAEIVDATNSAIFWSEGTLKVVPYGDQAATGNGVTWTPNLTPVYDLTEDDLVPINSRSVNVEIIDQTDAVNIVQVEFLDRANQYNTAVSPAFDDANIDQYGPRKDNPTAWHAICDAGIAQHAAQLLLQRKLYKRLRYHFSLPWDFVLLEPMDLVTLTTGSDALFLNRQLVRILEISEDGEGALTFTAEHVDQGTGSAALYAAHSGGGYQPNADIAPGPVNAPVLFNAPTSLTSGALEVWCAASSLSASWGGCEVWISADGSSYTMAGRITAPARYGVTGAAVPAHVDPDAVNTLSVDLTRSRGTLTGGTDAELNAAATLAMLGGELVAYRDATLTGANAYSLHPLRRGLFGTAPAAHPSGEQFVRLDDAIFKLGYAGMNVGETIHVKLPSFNVYGRATESLADTTAYTVALTPATALPDAPANLRLTQAWSGSMLSVTCDPAARATSYKFRFFAADETTLLREIVSATPSASYTASLAAQDGVQRAYAIEVVASNAAGDTTPSSWLMVANTAPAAVTSPAIAGGATTATATCNASSDADVAGYILFYGSASGFNPATAGGVVTSGVPSVDVFGLAAGTYYGRIAAYDGWTNDPARLNLSPEISFTIATGGGSTPSGGGTGSGGYNGQTVQP